MVRGMFWRYDDGFVSVFSATSISAARLTTRRTGLLLLPACTAAAMTPKPMPKPTRPRAPNASRATVTGCAAKPCAASSEARAPPEECRVRLGCPPRPGTKEPSLP
eukprot:CAMPEP_0197878630 /NCGR_PEP_ID=MMETSP1439-20131203/6962_1 /TAXON_ID=66791 /ORGANISM="Gonyaulax spinifera, Strain CCMP409" /LENGTH=105 /DNA_ID=CAMNT_0043498061 /DNA_START=96 /DNA_END=410 /DNA_ORIENTATION=-